MGISSAHSRANIDSLLSDISSYAAKIKEKQNQKTAPSKEIPATPSAAFGGKTEYLDGQAVFSLQQLTSSADYYKFSRPERGYAVNCYTTASDIDRPAEVLIDFMHEYNRSFDFKV